MNQTIINEQKIILPKDWKIKPLKDLISIRKGKKQVPIFNEKIEGALPHILIESFDGIYKKFTSSKKGELCKKDDIIIIWDGSRYGLVATNLEGYVGSTLGIITSKGDILKDFLFYFLTLNYNKIRQRRKGSGIPHIDKNFLLNLQVVYPQNKTEQQKIVEQLNKQFAHIEMMKKEAERQLESVEKFYISFLDKIFNERGSRWKLKKFKEIFTTRYGLSKKSVNNRSKTKALRMNNISYDGDLILNDLCYLDLNEDEINKHKLKKGNIIFNRTNSAELVGKTTIFDQDDTFVAVSYLVVASAKTPEINPEFVSSYLNSSKLKKYFYENCDRAISQANFNASKLNEILIPVPELKEQNSITSIIKKKKKILVEIKKDIQNQLSAISQLSSSILNKVFGQYEIPEEL